MRTSLVVLMALAPLVAQAAEPHNPCAPGTDAPAANPCAPASNPCAPAANPCAPAEAPRDVVVVSDLLMGQGRDAEGMWDAREEFRWTRALATFLDDLSTRTEPVDLVIAGNLLDLDEAPAALGCGNGTPCAPDKLAAFTGTVAKAHALDLALIGDWSSRSGNHVYIMPGDRDAALVDDAAWGALLEALTAPVDAEALAKLMPAPPPPPALAAPAEELGAEAATDPKATDPTSEAAPPEGAEAEEGVPPQAAPWIRRVEGRVWTSADGQVLVQSGPKGFVGHSGLGLLDKLESDLPLIDNLRPVAAGLLFVDEVAAQPEAVRDFLEAHAVRTAPSKPHRALFDPKADNPPPEWNLKRARKRGHLLFVDTLDPDDPMRAALLNNQGEEWGAVRDLLKQRAKEMSDEEVSAICDRVAIQRGLYGRRGAYPRCDGPKGTTQRLAGGGAQLEGVQVRALKESHPAMSIYVRSGAHLPSRSEVPLDDRGAREVTRFETGAFTRMVDTNLLRAMTSKRMSKNRVEVTAADLRESLGAFDLRHLPACYSAVLLDYDDDEQVTGSLKNWYLPRNTDAGEWVPLCARQCGWVSESCE